jgi:hypothetical protein
MDLQHDLHWLHLEPTHLLYYTGYTWSPLTSSTTLATLGAHSPSTTLTRSRDACHAHLGVALIVTVDRASGTVRCRLLRLYQCGACFIGGGGADVYFSATDPITRCPRAL